ncbi:MAG: hypothetical protein PWP51_421 [Clostridiales bacterium]|uniref:Uncharacterized protein n=1 Tax=Fusibacter paucivorans TaxID=76009 RepID=A0ABS5PMT9_9FIRM|nr:hypothetical protein [Fusibacter paucivorans]MBS7526495.1 hypothetical protein [Fusibacter paucivorans]MDK2866316.1 hypothetical protein [Clostridiales bacterium]MDN5297868.1 hypothetical protein [Clostridiales bacterium]
MKPRILNLVYQALLIFTLTQQIYWPQEYKYMHLAVLVVRMLLTEMYQQDYRAFKMDYWFAPLIAITTIVSIIEKSAGIQLSMIYLVSLMAATYLLLRMIGNVIHDSKQPDVAEKMVPKHVEVLEKGRKFIFTIFYLMYATILVSMTYTFYVIIQLLIS